MSIFAWQSLTGVVPRIPYPTVNRRSFHQQVTRDLIHLSASGFLRALDKSSFVAFDEHPSTFRMHGDLVDAGHHRWLIRWHTDSLTIPHDIRPAVDLLFVIDIDTRLFWLDWIRFVIDHSLTSQDRIAVVILAPEPIVYQEWVHIREWNEQSRNSWLDDLAEVSDHQFGLVSVPDLQRVIQDLWRQVHYVPNDDEDAMIEDTNFGRICHGMGYSRCFRSEWIHAMNAFPMRWTFLSQEQVPVVMDVQSHSYVIRNRLQAMEAYQESCRDWVVRRENMELCPIDPVTIVEVNSDYRVSLLSDRVHVHAWETHQPSVLYMTVESENPPLRWTVNDEQVFLSVSTQPKLKTLVSSLKLYKVIMMWLALEPMIGMDDTWLTREDIHASCEIVQRSSNVDSLLVSMHDRVAPEPIARKLEWMKYASEVQPNCPSLALWETWVQKLLLFEFLDIKDWWKRFDDRYAEHQEDMKCEQLIQQLTQQGREIPNELLCPITRALLKSPVVASDGFSYEEKAIQEWLGQGNDRSPMTNQPLSSLSVYPNHSIRHAIERFYEDINREITLNSQSSNLQRP
jgi:hypothetical protein